MGQGPDSIILLEGFGFMTVTVEAPTSSNDVANMLIAQVMNGLAVINKANETLLAETEQGSGVREIDKALKDFVPAKDDKGNNVKDESKDQDIVKAVLKLEKARQAFKAAQVDARNLYRTKVLGEEAQTESDDEVDVDQVKQQRKLVISCVGVLKEFAVSNSLPEIEKWADSLQIPQVGRQGTSAVGQKKPRAYVSIDGEVKDSFGEAAKLLSEKLSAERSTEDNKVSVEVTSGDLVAAWDEAGETETFEYEGHTVKVTKKETKSSQTSTPAAA